MPSSSFLGVYSVSSLIRRVRVAGGHLRPVSAALLIGAIAVGGVLASTPVTSGYRDQSYGGGSFRPTSQKPQSKLWYTDGQWFAGMFLFRTTPTPAKSEFHIYRLNETAHAWVDTGVAVDTRDTTHADYLWLESSQRLVVASAYQPAPKQTDDGIKIFKYAYNTTTKAYTLFGGFPVTIPGTATNPATPSILGGAGSVTIDQDSSGRLWAVWSAGKQVRYSTSSDGAVTWSTPAQVPTQANNPIRDTGSFSDIASVVTFGNHVGIGWSDHDALPAVAQDGYYFSVITAGADPATPANWSIEKLPTLLSSAAESADDHMNLKATSDGAVYMVGKTGKDTAGCATNRQLPLIEFFRRTPAGVWSTHLVGTVGDCNTRPQLLVSEQLDTAWVFLTAPNGAGSIFMKSAPLTGPEALIFRGPADTNTERGAPFIRSATETAIDDPTTTKQTVTAASGIVVLANNITRTGTANQKFYLHNEMAIAATDATPPVGTVAISNGAAFVSSNQVVVSVPATDAGSGVSLVRLSNSAAVGGDGRLTSGTTFSYTTGIGWNIGAGADGLRTVYAQWRDAAGNWSTPASDSTTLDTTGPTGTVVINGGAATTTNPHVTLGLSASDGSGSGLASVLISNTTDFTAATPIPFAASVPWTLPSGDGARSVYVKFIDKVGNVSATPVSDGITVDALPTGTVVINGGVALTTSVSVSLTFPNTSSDVQKVRVGNTANLSAVAWATYASGMTKSFTMPGGDGTKTVYAQFQDGSSGLSPVVSDTIVLDRTPPTGSVLINGGAATTTSHNVSVTFPTTAGNPTKVRVGTSADLSAVAYQDFRAGMSLPLTLIGGDGTKTAYAQFRDAAGNPSGVYSDIITLHASVDTVKPTVPGAPVHRVAGAVTTGFPIRLTWTASTDSGSGVRYYILQQSVNGGAYTMIGTPTARTIDLQLSSSSRTYRFRVAARDHDGNTSAFAYGIPFKTISTSESGAAMKYTKTWTPVSSPAYIGGKAKTSTTRGATATLTFRGNRVAWLSRKGPTSGVARIYIDGKLKATVDLYAPTDQIKQVVYQHAWTAVTTRTLRVVVLGTAGRPKITIDQFFSVR